MPNQKYNEAHRLLKAGQFAEALNLFNELIRQDPNNYILHDSRGCLLANQGRPDEAIADFNRVIELSAGNVSSDDYYNRARCFFDKRDFLSALQDLDDALELTTDIPLRSELKTKKGQTLLYLDRLDEALPCFEDVISHGEPIKWTYFYKARLHDTLKQHREAVACYEQTLSIDPNLFFVYFEKARSHYFLKEFPECIRDYEKTLQLNPNYKATFQGLGTVFLKIGNLQKAVENFDLALEGAKTSDFWYKGAIMNRSEALLQLQKFQDCIQHLAPLENLFQKSQEDHLIWLDFMKLSYEGIGDQESAGKYGEKHRKLASEEGEQK